MNEMKPMDSQFTCYKCRTYMRDTKNNEYPFKSAIKELILDFGTIKRLKFRNILRCKFCATIWEKDRTFPKASTDKTISLPKKLFINEVVA